MSGTNRNSACPIQAPKTLVTDGEPAIAPSTSNTLILTRITPMPSFQRPNYSETLFHSLVNPVILVPQLPGSNRTNFPLPAPPFTMSKRLLPREYPRLKKTADSSGKFKRPSNAPVLPCQRLALFHQIGQDPCPWTQLFIPPPWYRDYH